MTTAAPALFAGFADKQPAYLRSVIVPEDHEAFDGQYQAAIATAADTLDLTELDKFLEHWRRVAWSQHHMGHDQWRAMLAKAEYINRTGHVPPGTVTYSAEEIRGLIQARLAQD